MPAGWSKEACSRAGLPEQRHVSGPSAQWLESDLREVHSEHSVSARAVMLAVCSPQPCGGLTSLQRGQPPPLGLPPTAWAEAVLGQLGWALLHSHGASCLINPGTKVESLSQQLPSMPCSLAAGSGWLWWRLVAHPSSLPVQAGPARQ